MKKLLLIALITIVFFGCKRDEPVPAGPNIVGSTFSGLRNDYPMGPGLFAGYKFISSTKVLELFIADGIVLDQVELNYSYEYPNIYIDKQEPLIGRWTGVVSSAGNYLEIQNIKMSKQ